MKGQQKKVTTPKQYIDNLAEPRRSDVAKLHALITKTVPKLEPVIVMGMLGYGPFHYKYASGREGDTAKICVASNASYISLYAMAADGDGWVAERYKDRLPKAKIGKSCVRFKKLDDLDAAALKALLKESAKTGYDVG
ncbi:MAG: DUF1801 domain-containing protein [Deltaproteobacteria bacterium]|nr:DUF1801 domain-containing protein [Deltaproteobacteria bacterium]